MEEKEYMLRNGIKEIRYDDVEYPEALKNIYDPPEMLYRKGSILERDANAVAIVGSRKCTPYGAAAAEKLAFDLASRGVTVVSGMAQGIDAASHNGAIKAGGRTIAVMGSGFKHIYPPGSHALAESIASCGAVITEFPPDKMPDKSTFPRRNRIISGLSRGVVVVEAASRSGTSITARLALEQGREVLAVPGRIDSPTSAGTNRLIAEGARIVTSADDIIEELDLEAFDVWSGRDEIYPGMNFTEDQKAVLDMLEGQDALHIDRLTVALNAHPGRLQETVLSLQVKGMIEALPGSYYRINNQGQAVGSR